LLYISLRWTQNSETSLVLARVTRILSEQSNDRSTRL